MGSIFNRILEISFAVIKYFYVLKKSVQMKFPLNWFTFYFDIGWSSEDGCSQYWYYFFPPGQRFERLSRSLTGLLPYLLVWNACQLGLPFFILCFHRLISLLLLQLPLFSISFAFLPLVLYFWHSLVVLSLVSIYGSFCNY